MMQQAEFPRNPLVRRLVALGCGNSGRYNGGVHSCKSIAKIAVATAWVRSAQRWPYMTLGLMLYVIGSAMIPVALSALIGTMEAPFAARFGPGSGSARFRHLRPL
jgi:hypothetical protein